MFIWLRNLIRKFCSYHVRIALGFAGDLVLLTLEFGYAYWITYFDCGTELTHDVLLLLFLVLMIAHYVCIKVLNLSDKVCCALGIGQYACHLWDDVGVGVGVAFGVDLEPFHGPGVDIHPAPLAPLAPLAHPMVLNHIVHPPIIEADNPVLQQVPHVNH